MNKPTTGSVLVVGGGIAGIQASLDLADSGYRVVLAEQSSAIGGVMSQLDKTFPTNDCSMCIISPKLVEAGRHLNIDLFTMTDVEAISGEAGNFTVTLRQRPRFIDMEKCTACGECSKVCPIEVANDFDQGLRSRKAAFKRYPQAMPSAYTIEKKGTAPCKAACPANPSFQGCVALMAQGKYQEAFELFRSEHPFPGVCGRVCHHPCEAACTRGQVDEPVSIMADTLGTGKVDDARLTEVIRKVFDLTPDGIMDRLKLRRPIYRQTAAYGHFGRDEADFTWELCDYVEKLKQNLR